MVQKTPDSEIAHHRRISSQEIKLSAGRALALEQSPIEVVFSLSFLSRIPLRRSRRQLDQARRNVVSALKDSSISTFDNLISCSLTALQARHHLGPSSVALILDVMQCFGYAPKEGRLALRVAGPDTERLGTELADALQLPLPRRLR